MDSIPCRSCEGAITVMSLPCGEVLRIWCPVCEVPLEVVWSAREVVVTIGQDEPLTMFGGGR